MNPANEKNVCANNSISGERGNSYEETLRLLANIPVPEGLADRVQAGLLATPRQARVLAWPTVLSLSSNWMRATAAVAVAAVVAGGGWGVYSRVQLASPSRAIVMPSHLAAPGSFCNAGAMRTPQTLNGPQVAQPAAPTAQQAAIPAKPSNSAVPKVTHQARPRKATRTRTEVVQPAVK